MIDDLMTRLVKKIKELYRKIPQCIRNFFGLFLPIFLFLNLQPLTDWIKDYQLVYLSDLGLLFIFNFITSVIVSLVFYRLFIKNKFITLLFVVGAFFTLSQRIDMKMQKIWDFMRSFDLVSKTIDSLGFFKIFIFYMIFAGLLYGIFLWIDKFIRLKKWNLDIFYKSIVITVSVAFLIQFFTALHIIVIVWPQYFYRPTELVLENTEIQSDTKPDIYYIVLDCYTNQNVLKEQFNFNNSDFVKFLEERDFSIDPDAYSNYPNTATSIASTLNAKYHSDLINKFSSAKKQTFVPYFNSTRYSPVIKEFKKLDYSYYNIGSWYETSNQALLSDYNYMDGNKIVVFGRTFITNNFFMQRLTKNIYGFFVLYPIKIGNFVILSYKIDTHYNWEKFKIEKLKEIADKSGTGGPKFVFAHILLPHNPYVFNADGSLSEFQSIDNVGKPIKEKYTAQVEFINSQIKEVVEKIKQKSNNQAVIIIQSDEGPDPSQQNIQNSGSSASENESDIPADVAESNLIDKDLQMKFGVLAAYYIPQAKNEDVKSGGNSVNIFRLVLNTYFGYNLPYLPKYHYNFKGGSFICSDVTAQLTGATNPECPKDSIFSAQ